MSGPMRRQHSYNYHQFHAAARRWRDDGHEVFSPFEMIGALGYKQDSNNVPQPMDYVRYGRHVMMSDIVALYSVDAIALLPDWEQSLGATVELALAQFLDLKVFDAVTMEPKQVVITPWSAPLKV